jgi:hypothetical protein
MKRKHRNKKKGNENKRHGREIEGKEEERRNESAYECRSNHRETSVQRRIPAATT